MKEIIEQYRTEKKEKTKSEADVKHPEGWSMNDSPFRSRRSGLRWGGGNIRASEASRQTRKKFLKK